MGFEQRRTADGYMLRVMPDYYALYATKPHRKEDDHD